MAFRGTLKLLNGDALAKQLKNLDLQVQKTILREALQAGAKPIFARTIQDAPVKTGAIRRSIRVKTRMRKHKPIVLIQTASGNFRGDTFYAPFGELGTKERVQKRTGRKLGKMIQKNWMRGAFEAEEANAAAIVEAEIQAGIDRAL